MTRSLIVIDIQNDYFPGGVFPLWQAEETEARIISAIRNARENGDKVILIKHVSTAPAGLFAATSSGVDIRPAILDAVSDAPIVIKHVADAFQDTRLTEYLNGVQELLICGMMTQNCVVFSALSRAADAFHIRVVEDLCTAPTEMIHRIALNALRSKTTVMKATEIWSNFG